MEALALKSNEQTHQENEPQAQQEQASLPDQPQQQEQIQQQQQIQDNSTIATNSDHQVQELDSAQSWCQNNQAQFSSTKISKESESKTSMIARKMGLKRQKKVSDEEYQLEQLEENSSDYKDCSFSSALDQETFV